MIKTYRLVLFFFYMLWFSMQSVYGQINEQQNQQQSQKSYEEIVWTQLIPEDDLFLLINPPESVMSIEDGMQNDNLQGLESLSLTDPNAKRYWQALQSSRTIPEFDQKRVSIPGFIVPLNSNDEQLVTEFFIVPYFGACLHLPPPPPNQIIFARYPLGIEIETLVDAFIFDGKIVIDETMNSLGKSAYTMAVDDFNLYQE